MNIICMNIQALNACIHVLPSKIHVNEYSFASTDTNALKVEQGGAENAAECLHVGARAWACMCAFLHVKGAMHSPMPFFHAFGQMLPGSTLQSWMPIYNFYSGACTPVIYIDTQPEPHMLNVKHLRLHTIVFTDKHKLKQDHEPHNVWQRTRP